MLFIEPVIALPLAVHTSLMSAFSPMVSSVRPVTGTSAAANAGSEMAGTNANTITTTNSRDKKRLDIRWIMIIFSFSV